MNKPIPPERLLKDTPRILRDPLSYLVELTRREGEIVTFDIRGQAAIIVNDPNWIEHILVQNYRNYTKATVQFETFALVAGNGLLNSDGAFWLRQRRLAQPHFHHAKLVQWGQWMTDSAELIGRSWQNQAVIDMEHEMFALTLPIITQALFSLNTHSHADELVKQFTHTLNYVMYRARMPISWADRLPLPVVRRYHESMTQLERLITQMIENRRHDPNPPDDLLTTFIGARDEESGDPLPDQQIRDEIMTMILAGFETVATSLTWTWYLLSQHPEVVTLLHAELAQQLGGRVPTSADLPFLPYTRMVSEEALRLYPPAWVMSRRATEVDKVGDVVIPAGAIVIISPYTVHRNTNYWENPEQFLPERFSAENKRQRHRYAYIPFGGGARLCIGYRFAEMESILVLATLAQRFAPMPVATPHPIAMVTIRPKNGLPMYPNPR